MFEQLSKFRRDSHFSKLNSEADKENKNFNTNEFTYLKVECQSINRNGVLSGIILHDSSEKSLGKEEARHPEGMWFAIIEPMLKNKREK